MRRLQSITPVLLSLIFSTCSRSPAPAAELSAFPLAPVADFDYGKWKVSPGLMNEDRFGHDDRWLSFKIGAITVAPYVEHQEGLLDPYAPDTVHGTRLTIPLFGGLSLHARAFYIKPTQLPRGVSIDQPGEYVAFPSQSSREWRVTGEAHGFSFGPTWTW